MLKELFNESVHDKNGSKVDLDSLTGKTVGIYFSAHWCPPCRGFTPVLADFYTQHQKDLNLEIVFVSSDRDENDFNNYYKDMPWLCLKYEDRELKV